MPTIDLFNRAADEAKIAEAIKNDPSTVDKKLLTKYAVKSIAQGVILGGIVALAVTGALAVIAESIDNTEEDTE